VTRPIGSQPCGARALPLVALEWNSVTSMGKSIPDQNRYGFLPDGVVTAGAGRTPLMRGVDHAGAADLERVRYCALDGGISGC
jgi:hypothetical protein